MQAYKLLFNQKQKDYQGKNNTKTYKEPLSEIFFTIFVVENPS